MTTLALTPLPRLNMPVSNCFELLNHAQLRGWRGIEQKETLLAFLSETQR